jgi:hypothetical protein
MKTLQKQTSEKTTSKGRTAKTVKAAKTDKNTVKAKTPKVTKTSAVVRTSDEKQEVAQPEKKCRGACPSCQEEMTESFIKEVTEEVQNDELKVLWNKYGIFVILFVVLAVCAAVGFETIKGWRDAQYQAKTESYMAALQNAENTENTLKALEKIASGNNGIYSELAKIQIAGVLAEQNRIQEAEDMLQAIAQDDELSPRITHLAALKLATFKLDTAPREELETLLTPLVDAHDSWTPLASEMLAMVAIRDGDMPKAREIYENLMQNPDVSQNFKSRIQDMLSALNDM